MRFALAIGLTRKQVASDLGVGLSMLPSGYQHFETQTLCQTMTWTLSAIINGFEERSQ